MHLIISCCIGPVGAIGSRCKLEQPSGSCNFYQGAGLPQSCRRSTEHNSGLKLSLHSLSRVVLQPQPKNWAQCLDYKMTAKLGDDWSNLIGSLIFYKLIYYWFLFLAMPCAPKLRAKFPCWINIWLQQAMVAEYSPLFFHLIIISEEPLRHRIYLRDLWPAGTHTHRSSLILRKCPASLSLLLLLYM